MTDKTTYTVTMQVEVEAEGPARAVRQALDWARDTESGPAVITVQASNLSPLRAAVADGRVSQLFTGPVHTGVDPASGPDSTVHATIKQGVDLKKVLKLGREMQETARRALQARTNGRAMVQYLYDYGSELMRLLNEDDLMPGPICQKPAGVDPNKVRSLARLVDNAATTLRGPGSIGSRQKNNISGYLRNIANDLEALANDR